MGAAKTYSMSALSEELGRDRVILGKILAGVEPDAMDGSRSQYLMKTVVDQLVDGDHLQIKKAKDSADQDYKTARAELLRMELQEKTGKMVDISEAQGVVKGVLLACRTRILAIPSRLTARLAKVKDPIKVKSLLDRAINSALEEISNFDPTNLKPKRGKK